jgi:hypothetical protein
MINPRGAAMHGPWLAVLGLLLAGLAGCGSKEEKPPEEISVYGDVGATQDAQGNLTAVRVNTRKGRIYQVVLDEKGQQLGQQLGGKRVLLKGMKFKKDDVRWIEVKEFTEVMTKAEAEEKDTKAEEKAKVQPTGKVGGKDLPKPKGKPKADEKAPAKEKAAGPPAEKR